MERQTLKPVIRCYCCSSAKPSIALDLHQPKTITRLIVSVKIPARLQQLAMSSKCLTV